VNRRVVEGLVKCGAFDSLERNRARLLASLDEVLRWGAARAEERSVQQIGLFGQAAGGDAPPPLATVPAWSAEEELRAEREAIIQSGAPVVVTGALDVSDDRCQVIADEVAPLAAARAQAIRQVHVRVPLPALGRDGLETLRAILAAHPGPCDAFLHLERGGDD